MWMKTLHEWENDARSHVGQRESVGSSGEGCAELMDMHFEDKLS